MSHAEYWANADITPALLIGAEFLSGREIPLENNERDRVIPIMQKGLQFITEVYPQIEDTLAQYRAEQVRMRELNNNGK